MKILILLLAAIAAKSTPLSPAPPGYEWGTAFNNPLTGENEGFILVPIEVCCSDVVTFVPPISLIEPPPTPIAQAPEPDEFYAIISILVVIATILVLYNKSKD